MSLAMALIDYTMTEKSLYQLTASLITLVVIRICLFVRIRYKRHQLFKYYGIPGPKPDLIGGNLSSYRRNETHYKTDVEFHQLYGKTYGFFIGDEANMVTTDLEILRKIFFELTNSFKERTKVFLHTPLAYSVLFTTNDRWKVMRKVMSPSFSKYQMGGSGSLQFVEDSMKLMLNYIEDKFNQEAGTGNEKVNIQMDIQDLMQATALHMISSIAIKLPDVQVKENEPNVRSLEAFMSKADKGIMEFAIKFPLIKFVLELIATTFEYDQTIALIHRGLNKTLDKELERLDSIQKSNMTDNPDSRAKLIDNLIRLHHEGKMTRLEVIANADALLFAGYDTISTTITYIFWVLGKYPEIQDKLRTELMTYGTDSRYFEQVIHETMRLYPTVISFATRLATETVKVDGLIIPQGTKVIFHGWLMHKNPEIWPEPHKFDPGRFRPGVEVHPCAFAPFGLGERKCLGYQLAMLEMKMIICNVLLRYKIKTISPAKLELVTYAQYLTKPQEKVMIEIEKL